MAKKKRMTPLNGDGLVTMTDLYNALLNLSEDLARRTNGNELVDRALEAFDEAAKIDPDLEFAITSKADAWGSMVDWYKAKGMS